MKHRTELHLDFGDPVKHEARVKLWLPAIRQLREEVRRPLRYFTLPGPKAYDVLLWHKNDLIAHDGRGYPDVCFCEMDEIHFANAKRILGNTRGVKAPFEAVISSSKACEQFAAFWQLFPYDVYNLDFCGTWFDHQEEPVSATFQAIVNLVNTHVAARKSGPFLLFLTMRIDSGRMNRVVVGNLKDNVRDNCNNQRFAQAACSVVRNDVDRFVSRNFDTFVLVSVPKLIGFKLIPQTRRMAPKICHLSRAVYSRSGYRIGKFVFTIRKEPASLRVNPPSYCECVMKSFSLDNILQIDKGKVSKSTIRDLQALKSFAALREDS